MDKFAQPQEVSDPDLAFGGRMENLLPPAEEIPKEFWDWNSNHPALVFQQKWFFGGLKDEDLPRGAKDGIDGKKAMRHLTAIQRSWEPKHEHKVAAVAWLASRWFEFRSEEQKEKGEVES